MINIVRCFKLCTGVMCNMRPSTKEIARHRIRVLFEQAEAVHAKSPTLSDRYAQSARRIAMAAKIRLSPNFRRRVCKKCRAFLVYGENCRVRVRVEREPHVVITCLNCGWHRRLPFRKKKAEMRNEQDYHKDETPCQA